MPPPVLQSKALITKHSVGGMHSVDSAPAEHKFTIMAMWGY